MDTDSAPLQDWNDSGLNTHVSDPSWSAALLPCCEWPRPPMSTPTVIRSPSFSRHENSVFKPELLSLNLEGPLSGKGSFLHSLAT